MSGNLRTAGSCCLLLLSTFVAQNQAMAEDFQLKDQKVDETVQAAGANGPETDRTLTDGIFDNVYGGRAAHTDGQPVRFATARNNTVDTSGLNISAANIYGGYAYARPVVQSETAAPAGTYEAWGTAGTAYAGGTGDNGESYGNTVIFAKGTCSTVMGGYAKVSPLIHCIYEPDVDGDSSATTDLGDIRLSVSGGSGRAHADGNSVLNEGTVTDLYGGYAEAASDKFYGNVTGHVSFRINPCGDMVSMYRSATVTATGGRNDVHADGNTVLSSGGHAENVYGGFASSRDEVYAQAMAREEAFAQVTGGTAKAYAGSNEVIFNDGTAGYVYGGKAKAVTKVRDEAYAWQGQYSASATAGSAEAYTDRNSVYLEGGSYKFAAGGYAASSKEQAHEYHAVDGGFLKASASDNTVMLTMAEVTESLYGGYAEACDYAQGGKSASAEVHADGNKVELRGGSFTGSAIYAGYSKMQGTYDASASSLS